MVLALVSVVALGCSGRIAAGADAAADAKAVTYDWVLTAFTNQSESNLYVYRSGDGQVFDLITTARI
jgi:hypothetical protein